MTTPSCTCGPFGVCQPPEAVYVCAWCRRAVPWCFGAGDDMPEVCDDCWSEAHAEEGST